MIIEWQSKYAQDNRYVLGGTTHIQAGSVIFSVLEGYQYQMDAILIIRAL